MSRRLTILVCGSVAFWLLLSLPARYFWGDRQVVYSGVALLVCLVPMVGSLLWGEWAMRKAPEQQLVFVLGGTGLRMVVALAAGWLLVYFVSYFREGDAAFWAWLLVFYLFTLALELALVVGGRPAEKV